MWIKHLDKTMTEHSSQPDPAEALRRTLSEQTSIIQSHQSAFQTLCEHQRTTNQRLDQISQFLQNLQSPPAAPSPPGASTEPVTPTLTPTTFRDVTSPTPEKFSGELGRVGGFLPQCSLVFNRAPHSFPSGDAKISYVLGLLTGKALKWAENNFQRYPEFGCSFQEFVKELKATFDLDSDKSAITCGLWKIKQGQRAVAEFAIDLRTLAAGSSWNSSA